MRGGIAPQFRPVCLQNLVQEDLMGIIKHVADQFVVHAHAIIEIRRLEVRVHELTAYFRFDGFDDIDERGLFEVVSDDEHVEPAVLCLGENAGNDDELELAGLAEHFQDRIAFKHLGARQKLPQGVQVGKILIDVVSAGAHFGLDDLSPLFFLHNFEITAGLHQADLFKQVAFFFGDLFVDLGLFGDRADVHDRLGIEDEQAQDLDPRLAAEEFSKSFHRFTLYTKKPPLRERFFVLFQCDLSTCGLNIFLELLRILFLHIFFED